MKWTTEEIMAKLKELREREAAKDKGEAAKRTYGVVANVVKPDPVVSAPAPVVTDAVKAVDVPPEIKEPTDAELDAVLADAEKADAAERAMDEAKRKAAEKPVEPEPPTSADVVEPVKTEEQKPEWQCPLKGGDQCDEHECAEFDMDDEMRMKCYDSVKRSLDSAMTSADVVDSPKPEPVAEPIVEPPVQDKAVETTNPDEPKADEKPPEPEPPKIVTWIEVGSKTLADTLAELKIIQRNGRNLHILSCVHVEVHDDGVRLTATDLDQRLEMVLDASHGFGFGVACVSLDKLAAFAKGVGKKPVPIRIDIMSDGSARLSSPNGMMATLAGMPADDFPIGFSLDDKCAETCVGGSGFQKALKTAVVCSTQDNTRKPLKGVNVCDGDKIIGTDGRRLVEVTFSHGIDKLRWQYEVNIGTAKKPDLVMKDYDRDGIIVPASATWLFKSKLLAKESVVTIEMFKRGTAMLLKGGHWRYSCRLIDETYPSYKQIIPVSHKHVLEFADIKELADRVKAMPRNESAYFVKLSAACGKVRLDSGDGTCGFEINRATWNGDDGVIISLNPDYFTDALAMGCGKWLMNGYNPCIGVGEDVRYVLMPMRNK
jgi:DNA polymerase III sliding clamp (beta) subunit (PCNA family)